MSTRAKLKCISVIPNTGATDNEATVKFECLYDSNDKPEDNSFSKWTPSGSATFNITNPSALEQIKEGEYYYFDIRPCDG